MSIVLTHVGMWVGAPCVYAGPDRGSLLSAEIGKTEGHLVKGGAAVREEVRAGGPRCAEANSAVSTSGGVDGAGRLVGRRAVGVVGGGAAAARDLRRYPRQEVVQPGGRWGRDVRLLGRASRVCHLAAQLAFQT